MSIVAGPTRWPCSPAATPRPSRVPARFPPFPKQQRRVLCGSADPEAPSANSKGGNGLQKALQSATELLSSASSNVKQALASPTEATQPSSRDQDPEQDPERDSGSSGSNGASGGRHGSSNPLDEAAKRVKLAAKAVTGQSVHSVAASIDELACGAREASEGLQGAADKMDRQLKSALSSKDPVNAAPTSDKEQASLQSSSAATLSLTNEGPAHTCGLSSCAIVLPSTLPLAVVLVHAQGRRTGLYQRHP